MIHLARYSTSTLTRCLTTHTQRSLFLPTSILSARTTTATAKTTSLRCLFSSSSFLSSSSTTSSSSSSSGSHPDFQTKTKTSSTSSSPSSLSIPQRIESLIKENKVFVFMKGVPTQPQCGFSNQVVQILDFYKVPFKAFNVLSDDAMREGIKAYTDWPTIPQIFIDGEFIGGCDILWNMHESGDLEKKLNKAGKPIFDHVAFHIDRMIDGVEEAKRKAQEKREEEKKKRVREMQLSDEKSIAASGTPTLIDRHLNSIDLMDNSAGRFVLEKEEHVPGKGGGKRSGGGKDSGVVVVGGGRSGEAREREGEEEDDDDISDHHFLNMNELGEFPFSGQTNDVIESLLERDRRQQRIYESKRREANVKRKANRRK